MNEAQSFLLGYDRDLPLAPEVRQVTVHDRLKELRLTYLSSGPVRVPAVLTVPYSGIGSGVLIQHGGGESKDTPLIQLLMRRWAASGLACLAIDAPGHGDRAVPGVRGIRRGFFEYLRLRIQNVVDLRRGIDYLVGEAGVDPNRLGYWGVSMGGGVGVMLMAADERVRAACLCLAGARSRRTWPEVEESVAGFAGANLDPLALAPLIGQRHVLMLNGGEDPTVSREDALRLFEALPGPKEQRWFKAGHKVTSAMLRASREFFEQVLID